MRHPSLYRVGGLSLLIAGPCFILGILLHAPQPMSLTDAMQISMGNWKLSHGLLALGSFLALGGFIGIGRHLARGPGEGWGVVGLGGIVAGAAGFLVVVSPEFVAYPMLAGAQAGGMGNDQAFVALNLGVLSLATVAGTIFWLGAAAFGLALAADPSWPRIVGYAGVAIGLVVAVLGLAVEDFALFRWFIVLGSLWIAVLGFVMNGLARGAAGTA